MQTQVEQGKGTTDHLMPFGDWFSLEVTAFPRYTTVWWLLDLAHSDLFTLVGYSFIRKNSNIKNQMTNGKNFLGATK